MHQATCDVQRPTLLHRAPSAVELVERRYEEAVQPHDAADLGASQQCAERLEPRERPLDRRPAGEERKGLPHSAEAGVLRARLRDALCRRPADGPPASQPFGTDGSNLS